jgi:predicted Zn-dependent peptidase
MSLEQAQGRMFYSAQNYIKTTKIESLDEIIKQVRDVGCRKINDFAKELFDFKNLAVSVVGNAEQDLANKIKAQFPA